MIDFISKHCLTPFRMWLVFFIPCVFGALLGLVASTAFAARTINTLPWSESFNQNNYSDLLWLSPGATHSWQPTAGFNGSGAAKITGPSAEGYGGLGQFLLARNLRPEQLNVRVLVWHGRTWATLSGGGKFIIMNREGNRGRPMFIYGESGAMDTLGACDGTVCKFRQNDTSNMQWWANGTERFKIGNGSGMRSHEWISIEAEANTRTGMIRLYIDTQDGQLSGLYLERPMDDTGTGGLWSHVDIIGGYMNRGNVRADPENYFMLDEIAIATSRIGPPAGFRGGTPQPPQLVAPVLISAEGM